jgi:hypothetical protein
VDLDEYYEYGGIDGPIKWVYKQTAIEDDFESGTFDSGWGTNFKSSYSIVDMWGNKCATGPEESLLSASNFIEEHMDLEWEFSRTSDDGNPFFSLVNEVSSMKVEWDYENSQLNVQMFDQTTTFNYNLNDFNLVKDLDCSNSLRFLGVRVITYTVGDDLNIQFLLKFRDEWMDYTHIFNAIPKTTLGSYTIDVKADGDSGFSYFKLQSHCGFPYNNGNENYPLTFFEFTRMTALAEFDDGEIRDDMPTADYRSKFYMKNFRKTLNPYHIMPERYYEIDAWDMDTFGPWMLIWDIHTDTISRDEEDTWVVSFACSKISNGIMYNIRESIPGGWISPNLEITYANDMFIVWSSENVPIGTNLEGRIRLFPCKTPNRDFHNHYVEIHGSTIKSERGFLSFLFDS